MMGYAAATFRFRHRYCACAVVLVLAAAGCGGASLTGPSDASGRRAFTVMTFNVQHGLDASGRYNLQNAIDVIARVQPDLVGVQELTRNHPSYNCDDQPAIIAQGLRAATGRAWSQSYVREWFTPDHTCLDRGAGTDVETEGLAFFAPESIGVLDLPLFQTRLALATRTPGGAQVPVITTQLASGTAALNDRMTQVSQLLPWAAGQGAPRVLMGDFNSRPDAPELQPVVAEYHDAWMDALGQGTAAGVVSGDTRVRGGRIDYVFYAGEGLQVQSAEIVDTTALLGARTEASDHRPVVVRFAVK